MYKRTIRPKDDFTMIPNKIMEDSDLSLGAFKMYTTYLRMRPTVNITDKMLMKELRCTSKTTVIEYRKELINKGYAQVERIGGNVRFIYLTNGEADAEKVKRIMMDKEAENEQ